MEATAVRDDLRKSLSALFAGYRAEWLNEEVFKLFTEPSYFPQLLTPHPCFLFGGRGSGKTTVLRCLSYEGQYATVGKRRRAVEDWDFFGLYYRINTNRVAAFEGPEVDERTWIRLFGHYLNLELCERVFRFLNWYSSLFPDAPQLTKDGLGPFAAAMAYERSVDQAEMASLLEISRLRFEALINSVGDQAGAGPGPLSMQGAPLDALMRAVRVLPQFRETHFFFLLDEYENFSDVQQRICNTLIKHCGELYSFKVGVRELGLRQRSTLNAHEQLTHPADYKRIDISDELEGRFPEFAEQVCLQRLKAAIPPALELPGVETLLPGLSADEEANLLGVASVVAPIRRELTAAGTEPARDWIATMPDLELFALGCRAEAEEVSIETKAASAFRSRGQWKEQYENYKHAYLFAVRRRKRGIRKYYAGWRTYCAMSATNIRFLLELVDQALTRHLDSESDPLSAISPETQTEAAQFTGRKNLREMEGVSIYGAKLTRVLLGLGRVFQVLAEDPVGHTPEVNQFHVVSDEDEYTGSGESDRVDQLLTAAVMHLAFLRYSGSKLQEESDIRQYDFAVHPIYAAFFGFSHRRKRKLALRGSDLVTLMEDTSQAVRAILARQNRPQSDDLPDQLRLFEGFYAVQD